MTTKIFLAVFAVFAVFSLTFVSKIYAQDDAPPLRIYVKDNYSCSQICVNAKVTLQWQDQYGTWHTDPDQYTNEAGYVQFSLYCGRPYLATAEYQGHKGYVCGPQTQCSQGSGGNTHTVCLNDILCFKDIDDEFVLQKDAR
jgi:hypothetical protein